MLRKTRQSVKEASQLRYLLETDCPKPPKQLIGGKRLRISRAIANAEPLDRISERMFRIRGDTRYDDLAGRRHGLTVLDTREALISARLYGLGQLTLQKHLDVTVPSFTKAVDIPVTGITLLGPPAEPFVALLLDVAELKHECSSDIDSIQHLTGETLGFPYTCKPHVSVARAYSPEDAVALKRTLQPVRPETIALEAAMVYLGPS